MSEELVSQVQTEVERIAALPLAEQVNDFSALRDKLESVLNDSENSLSATSSGSSSSDSAR